MPKNTKVDRCFQKVKGEKGESSAAAICQSSTGQSLATGKKTRKSDGKRIASPHEAFERRLDRALSILEANPLPTTGQMTPALIKQYQRGNRMVWGVFVGGQLKIGGCPNPEIAKERARENLPGHPVKVIGGSSY